MRPRRERSPSLGAPLTGERLDGHGHLEPVQGGDGLEQVHVRRVRQAHAGLGAAGRRVAGCHADHARQALSLKQSVCRKKLEAAMRDTPGLSTDARFIRYRSFRRDPERRKPCAAAKVQMHQVSGWHAYPLDWKQ